MWTMKFRESKDLFILNKLHKRGLDSMIGRAAHIAFLENQALIKLFIYSFEEIFEWFMII